ncbi:leucyl/phenylalanyl-tRNA--protein transferase [Jannaschia aquimarina]|uniref:Leucyl/phenylalanyl-tRNA--protein transferase n=1 Tax=Jannaschia aquimarina TaxID=935700 RepID=A0A0D1CIB8_9RHOB|nr:leucyl/phenylalanyl-tRNA--protein transferase [Jannaschia aquimarina]KIT14442.1 Leucyl/phenylalanyl-tRNA--protein transferase [Jannaschia aquimarina]SNT29315.1 leucyl/phenylalanyl-tRNA--protein transferase [Jannaschia aquimarina]
MPRDAPPVTAETLLMAYASGVFPMAETQHDPEIYWVDPERRGVLPLDGFRMSRSLAKTIRRGGFDVTLDEAFDGVLQGCSDRDETWINAPIAQLYRQLHRIGLAHSFEIWDGPDLVGGVYGVTLGSAFFGESMFSRMRDASKLALAWSVATLARDGYTLFDTQFLTDHLASLGAVEISRRSYHAQLRDALDRTAKLKRPLPGPDGVLALRSRDS